ncbi:MAG: hypothetical protein K5Q00_03360 [Gammaproteobacteria bacterium]|nr:hypothetical protein [Gammaproteobacteria bacterium]
MVKNNHYTKKVIFKSESSSAAARAERLKKLRNLANLTREDICNAPGLNVNTFKGWELGRFGGLTKDGAERVIARVAQENVLCSLDWLLHNQGANPIVIASNASTAVSDESIQKELSLFQALFNNILYTEIQESQITGHYQLGDIVAGVKLSADSIAGLIGQVCIVETERHEIVAMKLLKSIGGNQFLLRSLSGDTQTETTLISAARIIRHYRLT